MWWLWLNMIWRPKNGSVSCQYYLSTILQSLWYPNVSVISLSQLNPHDFNHFSLYLAPLWGCCIGCASNLLMPFLKKAPQTGWPPTHELNPVFFCWDCGRRSAADATGKQREEWDPTTGTRKEVPWGCFIHLSLVFQNPPVIPWVWRVVWCFLDTNPHSRYLGG